MKLVVFVIKICLFFTVPLHSNAMTVWTGNGDGVNWFDAANWNNGVPDAGGDALINSGNIMLTNETAMLNSIVFANCTLTFSNWNTRLSADTVVIQNNATITHVTNSATSVDGFGEWPVYGRVWIACSDLDIQQGGKIDVNGRGFMGGQAAGTSGYGPGGGTGGANYGGGGGHGAPGGAGTQGTGGLEYGITNAPVMPGSGGGALSASPGGGAVRIEAGGSVTINGIITANGTRPGQHGGSGSGGSIYITCHTLSGTTNGHITAMGGITIYAASGSGAGGRIAVVYDKAAQEELPEQPRIRFNVACGPVGRRGRSGTLYLPCSTIFQPDMSHFEDVRIYGVTNWSVDYLSIINATYTNNIVFSEPRFTLKVTNALNLNSAFLRIGSDMTSVEHTTVICGAVIMSDNSRFYVHSGPTNAASPDYGALVEVAGDIAISGNSWIHPVSDGTNGGSVFFTANNITISAGSGFDADGLGYFGGNQSDGHGPGGGKACTVNPFYGGGGGYGGKGGTGRAGSAGGTTYWWTNAPVAPGSGGAGASAGNGGGLVRIKVSGTTTLDGTITANGKNGSTWGAGGSGGAIFLITKALKGTGHFSACGGEGQIINTSNFSGGGGGGRIAVWHRVRETDQFKVMADPDNAESSIPRTAVTNDFTPTDFSGTKVVSEGWGHSDNAEHGTFVVLTVTPPEGIVFSGY